MMMNPRKQLLALSLLLTIVALAIPADGVAQSADDLVQSDTVDAVVHVRGMACEMCAQNMKQSLETVEGIESAHINLDEQNALIRWTDGTSVSSDVLRETVTNAGYEFKGVVFDDEASDAPQRRR